jgi:diguanylate cyclase (GGDEF)-like protein
MTGEEAPASSATEQLLQESWQLRGRNASARELTVEACAAVAFAVAAAALLVVGGGIGRVPLGTAALLVGLYALLGRIEFPIGSGLVVPTQLVLFPMLMLLPPAIVPVAVAVALVFGSTLDWALGRAPARRILGAVPDAWHAVGAAAVLVIAGSPQIDFENAPLMAIAFVACCVTDLLTSFVRVRLIGLVRSITLHARVMLGVWLVDASLAPLGFLAGIGAMLHTAAILFVLPLAFLLWLLANDRRRRIEQAQQRLGLVQQERVRLHSAVRRLGDVFATKLDLPGLCDTLLHACVDALDAAGGRIELRGLAAWHDLEAGDCDALLAVPARSLADDRATLAQLPRDGFFVLLAPLTISSQRRTVDGTLMILREGRPFDDDEIALTEQLIAKAELAAAETLNYAAMREELLTDPLTGLGNRQKLRRDLAALFKSAPSAPPQLLLMFDLNGFKNYNDTFGHLAGDELLARLGERLRATVDARGAAYRLGGDEFCATVAIDGRRPHELIAELSQSMSEAGELFTVRAAVGAVKLPLEASTPDDALRLADHRMYADKRHRSVESRDQARDVLVRTIHLKLPDLEEHSNHVAEMATRLAFRLGVHGDDLDEVARAAELHDVGKVGIPEAILNKEQTLDREEWDLMRRHTILGEQILSAAPTLRPLGRLVRATHERWDGTGYPDGLRGEEIPLGARIIAVCDAYDAMVSKRPYAIVLSEQEARRELRDNAGSQFDPVVVAAFFDAVPGDAPARRLSRFARSPQPAADGADPEREDLRFVLEVAHGEQQLFADG